MLSYEETELDSCCIHRGLRIVVEPTKTLSEQLESDQKEWGQGSMTGRGDWSCMLPQVREDGASYSTSLCSH